MMIVFRTKILRISKKCPAGCRSELNGRAFYLYNSVHCPEYITHDRNI